MEINFLSGEPAVIIDNTMVVTDLHIGIEHEYWKSGVKMPSQTSVMKKRLESLVKKTGVDKLIICGDVKHKVPGITKQEEREIPKFLNHFSKLVKVEVVKGNHDADLAGLVSKKIKIHSSKGFLNNGVYLMHGHTWPDKKILESKILLCGHVQPQIEIKDKLGYVWREPVWVKTKLRRKSLKEKYGSSKEIEFIIIPSFNQMAGGLALNKAKVRESPILKLAKMRNASIHMLDGTFLGELGKL